jgi:hypothetical protein
MSVAGVLRVDSAVKAGVCSGPMCRELGSRYTKKKRRRARKEVHSKVENSQRQVIYCVANEEAL